MRAFGVEREFRFFRGVAERSAFIVDRDGVVRFAQRYEDSEVPDFDELVAAANDL